VLQEKGAGEARRASEPTPYLAGEAPLGLLLRHRIEPLLACLRTQASRDVSPGAVSAEPSGRGVACTVPYKHFREQ